MTMNATTTAEKAGQTLWLLSTLLLLIPLTGRQHKTPSRQQPFRLVAAYGDDPDCRMAGAA